LAHYLDTSALVKLVVAKAETTALRAWLAETDRPTRIVTYDERLAQAARANEVAVSSPA